MKKIRFIIAVLTALSMLAAIPVMASGTTIDWDRTGSITVTLHDSTGDHEIVPGVTLILYHVADAVSENYNLGFEYTEDFEGCSADLSDLNAAGLADQLLAYAETNGIEGTVVTAGEDGAVVFEDLPLGLYLIAQVGEVEGYYPIDPFIVTIPMTNPEGTGWIYDIDASPKAEEAPISTPEPVFISLTIRKVWDDEDNAQNLRPDSISVYLLMDGERIDMITLTAENDWSYLWEGLEDGHSYTVEEVVPMNYVVSYNYTGVEIIMTNTAKLIQTGQLNWPIPVLGGIGVVLLIVGLVVAMTGKRKNDA